MNALKENNSPHFTAFPTKIHREIHRISYKNTPHWLSNVYWIWFKFIWKSIEVRDIWRSELRRWSHEGGRGSHPCKLASFFRNIENSVKTNNSSQFTAHTAKRCKENAVKIFFTCISPHFLRKFTAKPRLGLLRLFVHTLMKWLNAGYCGGS